MTETKSLTSSRSNELLTQARTYFPGGVNSPVRTFSGVGGQPKFIAKGKGARIFDVDGNAYLDYVQSWGPLALGHAHPGVVEAICKAAALGTSFGAPTENENTLAELIQMHFPAMERMRFVSSGTESAMSAIRLARCFTKRDKLVKFAGCYHGHSDALLAKAGSGALTLSIPGSAGVTQGAIKDTIVLEYNDADALKKTFDSEGDGIAAVILEPIAGNMGFVRPTGDFLGTLESVCRQHGALLIFDEIITGFRVALGGAQSLWNIRPDLICLGKVIGGGLPLAAYGGRAEIMEQVAPLGPMYQAGTLSGNPVATAAGAATIRELSEPGVFERMRKLTTKMAAGLAETAKDCGKNLQIDHEGSLFGFFFIKEQASSGTNAINNLSAIQAQVDSETYARFFHGMMDKGHYFAPSAFEAAFVSAAHTDEDIENTLTAARETMKSL
jgi:glutamate-1-semialdehyde 2,1-aminomutase